MNGNVEQINTNDVNSSDINITSLFKLNVNYTMLVLATGNIPVNSLNVATIVGDVPVSDDFNILTTINNLPIDMYKLMFVFSSVVVDDRVYCLYYLTDKDNNDPILCVGELNLETYESDWIYSLALEFLPDTNRPIQLLANL